MTSHGYACSRDRTRLRVFWLLVQGLFSRPFSELSQAHGPSWSFSGLQWEESRTQGSESPCNVTTVYSVKFGASCLCEVAAASGLVLPASRNALEGRGFGGRICSFPPAMNALVELCSGSHGAHLRAGWAGEAGWTVRGLPQAPFSDTWPCFATSFPPLSPGYRSSYQLCLSALPWCSA